MCCMDGWCVCDVVDDDEETDRSKGHFPQHFFSQKFSELAAMSLQIGLPSSRSMIRHPPAVLIPARHWRHEPKSLDPEPALVTAFQEASERDYSASAMALFPRSPPHRFWQLRPSDPVIIAPWSPLVITLSSLPLYHLLDRRIHRKNGAPRPIHSQSLPNALLHHRR